MPPELRALLEAVRDKCGSQNKMALRMGIGASSVLAYFKDSTLPGFDKIPILADLSGESQERVRALLTAAHEARARKGHPMSFLGPASTVTGKPSKPPVMARGPRLPRHAMAAR